MFEIKPKTRKEIYMAYLAGDMSLELPEPMTRDEVTLYNLCQSHAYGSTTTVKEVLAECQPVFNNTMQGCLIGHGQKMALTVGETYIVTMDGKEYTTIPAVDMTTMDDERMWVGLINEGANLETGEGTVFMVVSFVPEFAAGVKCPGMVRTMDGSVPSTISIRQEITTVTKISGKYVEGMGWAEKSVSGKVVVEETAYRVNSDFGTLVNPEPLENGYASMPTEFSFESGKTYRITVDGVPYIGTAEYREGYGNFGGGDGVPLVDENGGYHGVFVTAMGAGYSNYFYYDEGPVEGHTGTFIIEEVAEVETIHPIDPEFLPGGVGHVIKLKQTEDGITCDEHTPAEVVEILSNNPFTRMCLEFEDNLSLDYAMTFYFSAVSVIGSNGAFLVTFFTAIEPNSPIYKLVVITPDGFALEGE